MSELESKKYALELYEELDDESKKEFISYLLNRRAEKEAEKLHQAYPQQ